jgi:outer membrane murein-binding lipoprotein Lpp
LATNAAVLAFLDLLNGCAKQLMDQLKTAHDNLAAAHARAKQRLPAMTNRAHTIKNVKVYEQNRGAFCLS